ncbi:MAG TPA: hypothetical protein VFF59_01135 [Anaerolineae bacterium]|nr:hypothetical protein [Anaerolineae bacterium]
MTHTIEIAVETGGSLVIPGKLWKTLKLEPGTVFIAEPTDQDDVRLTPQSEATMLAEEDGLLVATGEAIGDQIDFVQQERDRRIFDLTLIEKHFRRIRPDLADKIIAP